MSFYIPQIGDEVAIKCPPDPPFPEGWYAAVVIDVIEHHVEDKLPSSKKGRAKMVKDFTLHVEWDGGGVEELRNPEWRMKVDAPDKQGRISHRDAKVSRFLFVWHHCQHYQRNLFNIKCISPKTAATLLQILG